jgi:lysophospholipid acyltransferase (LPLAT)-like uncharacterized protein
MWIFNRKSGLFALFIQGTERECASILPGLLEPPFHLYGYGSAALLHGVTLLIRNSCRFERSGPSPAPSPRIECIWHEHLPTYIASYLPPASGQRYAWLNHPVWYMRGVHVLLSWNGVSALALGSSGHDGQRALERVLTFLREGYSTLVAVDGPAGPRHRVKRGALDMALQSGCPLVAIDFRYEPALRAPGWDGKRYPLPGSRVWIRESPELHVDRDNYDRARAELGQALGSADAECADDARARPFGRGD